jgi:hypothetical protein
MISSLKFLCSRRLRLAAIAHTYPILLHVACYSCLLARTIRVGVAVIKLRHCHAVKETSQEMLLPIYSSLSQYFGGGGLHIIYLYAAFWLQLMPISAIHRSRAR